MTVIMRRGKLTQRTGRLTQPTGRLTQPTGRLTQPTGRLTQLNQSRRNPIYLSRDLCGITKSGTVDPPLYYCQVSSTVSSDADCSSTDVSLIPAQSHTLVEIDNEIISMVILLLPLIQEGLMSVTRESLCTKYWLIA